MRARIVDGSFLTRQLGWKGLRPGQKWVADVILHHLWPLVKYIMTLSVREPGHTQPTLLSVSYGGIRGWSPYIVAKSLYLEIWTTGAIVVKEGIKLIGKSSQQASLWVCGKCTWVSWHHPVEGSLPPAWSLFHKMPSRLESHRIKNTCLAVGALLQMENM